jgi:hypothetical protein
MRARLLTAPEQIRQTSYTAEQQKELTDKADKARVLADTCEAQIANHDFANAAVTFDQVKTMLLEVAKVGQR